MRFHPFIYTFLFTLLNVAACLFPIAIQAQSKTEKENFKAKVAKMHKTLQSNPDEGYKELKALLAQAEKKTLKNPNWYCLPIPAGIIYLSLILIMSLNHLMCYKKKH